MQRVQFEVADSATLTLVDSLSVAIIRVAWRGRDAAPALRSVALTSASLPAVHAYLAGEQAARRGDWSTAMGQFEHAIQLDSAFALAYASLATASGWVDGEATPETLRMLERGSRYAHQLSAQDRRRFNVHLLFTRGVPECVDSAQAFSAACSSVPSAQPTRISTSANVREGCCAFCSIRNRAWALALMKPLC